MSAQQQHQTSGHQFLGRPIVIIVMTVFLFLQGLFFLVAGCLSWIGIAVIVVDVSRGSMLLLHGILYIILGMLSVIFAAGMFLLLRWAFWATIIIACVNLVVSTFILFSTHFTSFGHIINIVVSLVILFFFLRYPEVRAAFFRHPRSAQSHA